MSYQYPVFDPKIYGNYQNPNNVFYYNQQPSSINPPEEEIKEEEPKEIVHQVNPCDTLFGISLQYDVPVEKIKTYNNLHTEDIYYLKEIKIPNAKTICFPPYNDEDVMQTARRQYLLYFATLVNPEDSRDEKMMHYYLSEHDYDVQAALAEYKKDLEFEAEQKKKKTNFKYQKMEFKKFN